MPKPYPIVDKAPLISNGKTPAAEEQIEACKSLISTSVNISRNMSYSQQPQYVLA